VLDRLPVGVVVVDASAGIRCGNLRVAEMLGVRRDALVGRSLLEFVLPDDLAFAGELMHDGHRFPGQVMGPVRIRYVDAAGRVRSTEFWARHADEVLGGAGFVLTLTDEAATDHLSEAVRSIASGDALEVTLGHVVAAVSGHPLVGVGALLVHHDDELLPVGGWPLPPGLIGRAFDRAGGAHRLPWWTAVELAEPHDLADLDELPDDVAAAASRLGFEAVWARPVRDEHVGVTAVLVTWRYDRGLPSPNHRRSLDDAVGVTALAFGQSTYRRQLEHAVYTDALTGLGTRARLGQIALERDDSVAAVLYVDLDGFKLVNDAHGHAIGDTVLAHVATRLQGAVRGGDEIVRLGGDEFVVVLRAPSPIGATVAVAERIVDVLAEPFAIDTRGPGPVTLVRIGASVGISHWSGATSVEALVVEADRAMYAAKAAGKNCWRLADVPASAGVPTAP
jgi:diguanylate cyclase (GGDEF)-like protein